MNNEKRLLVRVSELYYHDGLTQNQIAKQLNLSRIKISRLLKKALETGVVTININYDGLFSNLETELENKYNLDEIIIVEGDAVSCSDKIAKAAGYYLNQHIKDGEIITVGWGDTLRRTVDYCSSDLSENTIFTPIIGGHSSQYFSLHSNTISSGLADKYKAKSLSLLAPAFVSTKGNKAFYMNENNIKEVINCSKKANKAIFSVGFPQHENSTIVKTGYFQDWELQKIKESEAVCDIASIVFLNLNGESILSEFTDRSIGLNENELREIPQKICIAGGINKHQSIEAALKAGLINTLITDIATAEYLSK